MTGPGQRPADAIVVAVMAVAMLLLMIVMGPGTARQAAREGFVGSDTCAGCHQAQHADWFTSDHSRAMAAAHAGSVLGAFDGRTVEADGQRAHFRREGERFLIRTEGADGVAREFEISETFGADPLQQYLVHFPDGRRQVLAWAWDARPREAGGQRWYHLMPDARPGEPLHWTGRDQNWNFMCAACHSTGLVRGYEAARNRYDTTWTEIAVGCESCHGRGAAHVAWARNGARPERADRGLEVRLRDTSGGAWRFVEGDPRGIARWEGPPRQATVAGVETCAPCHARARPLVADPPPGARFLDTHAPLLLAQGEYHPNGQMQGEVFEWGSYMQSRMQRAGVVCADCHLPHSARLRAEGNAVCAQCHLPQRFEAVAHHGHAPGSPGAQCTACHMPAVTYMGVDRRRDHRFAVPRPAIATAVGAPDVCAACHTDRPTGWSAAQLTAWHGPRSHTSDPALAIQAGREGRRGADLALSRLARDRDQPAILRATALSLLPSQATPAVLEALGATLLDPEPLVRAAALQALAAVPPRARLPAARLLTDEFRLVRIEAARALAPLPKEALPQGLRGAFDHAFAELLASERVAAERPEAHVNIAELFAQRGEPAAAEAAYNAALALDPNFLPALVNMAGFEQARGRLDSAETLLRRALAAHPGEADPLHALALLAVRRGRLADANEALARAATLAPADPRHAHVQGLVLQRLGRLDEAVEALARHPAHRDSLLSLATLEAARGRPEAALPVLERALALDPGDRDAQALLARIRVLPATQSP